MIWVDLAAKKRQEGYRPTAQAAERAGVKDAELAFKKEWVAPGFAQIRGARQSVHLLFFMKEATRARMGARQDSTKCTREQEYAPPADLPEDCLSLFTDGSAMYDKGYEVLGLGWLRFCSRQGRRRTGA